MKKALLFLLFLPMALFAQNEPGSVQFWKLLKNHCGKSYSGEIIAGGKVGDGFVGEKLVLHVRSCEKNEIRMPFVVGDNHSRTWVLTLNDDNRIQLKHDHRNPDGSDEEITQYGGLSSNRGLANIQFFPADQFTSNLLPGNAIGANCRQTLDYFSNPNRRNIIVWAFVCNAQPE